MLVLIVIISYGVGKSRSAKSERYVVLYDFLELPLC